jgi:hypothetical protein
VLGDGHTWLAPRCKLWLRDLTRPLESPGKDAKTPPPLDSDKLNGRWKRTLVLVEFAGSFKEPQSTPHRFKDRRFYATCLVFHNASPVKSPDVSVF